MKGGCFMAELVLNVKELQDALGIGRDTAYELMRNEAFPSIRIGGRYMVEKEALQAWLKRYQGKQFVLQ